MTSGLPGRVDDLFVGSVRIPVVITGGVAKFKKIQDVLYGNRTGNAGRNSRFDE